MSKIKVLDPLRAKNKNKCVNSFAGHPVLQNLNIVVELFNFLLSFAAKLCNVAKIFSNSSQIDCCHGVQAIETHHYFFQHTPYLCVRYSIH